MHFQVVKNAKMPKKRRFENFFLSIFFQMNFFNNIFIWKIFSGFCHFSDAPDYVIVFIWFLIVFFFVSVSYYQQNVIRDARSIVLSEKLRKNGEKSDYGEPPRGRDFSPKPRTPPFEKAYFASMHL